jgi:hypothetical protein
MAGVILDPYFEELDLISAISLDAIGLIFPFDKIPYFHNTFLIIRWYVTMVKWMLNLK